MAVKYTYFQLFARGPAVAVALELSGIEWEGSFPEDWKTMKPTTPWRELPVLEVPGVGFIGHEIAILNWIERNSSKIAGNGEQDKLISDALMFESEDLYRLLMLKQDTSGQKEKVSAEEYQQFWGPVELNTHNKNFGVSAFMTLLEEYHGKCGGEQGKFTSTGISTGECKLWSTLHCLKMIKDDVLDLYPAVAAFYARFTNEPATQALLTTGAKMPAPFNKYFVERA